MSREERDRMERDYMDRYEESQGRRLSTYDKDVRRMLSDPDEREDDLCFALNQAHWLLKGQREVIDGQREDIARLWQVIQILAVIPVVGFVVWLVTR